MCDAVEPCSGSGVRHGDQDNLENAGGPAATSAAGLPLSEHDRPVPSMDDRAVDDDAGEDTAAVREEQERKQRQLKEEQLAAAQAAFAPKPIPASASALAASQPTHDNFPPGFAPPSASSKHSPALPHARKLSAYDGVSFGVRDQAFSPAPTPPARVQSARTSGRHSAAPSPYTPPTYGTSVRQIGTPRMTSSVAASRWVACRPGATLSFARCAQGTVWVAYIHLPNGVLETTAARPTAWAAGALLLDLTPVRVRSGACSGCGNRGHHPHLHLPL